MTHTSKVCPICGRETKRYDRVKRILRTYYGEKHWILIERYSCRVCGTVHRSLPNNLLPYKHYDRTIIEGFMAGKLTSDSLVFEDYPCEQTIKRWQSGYFPPTFI